MMAVSKNNIFDPIWSVAAPAAPHKDCSVASAELQICLPQVPLISSLSRQIERVPIVHGNSGHTSTRNVCAASDLDVKLYRDRPVGSGRHAHVYLAQCHRLGQKRRICAAKVLSSDTEAQLAALNEADLLGRLRHSPYVAAFIGLKEDPAEDALPTDRRPAIGSRRVSRTQSVRVGSSARQSAIMMHARQLSIDSAISTEVPTPGLSPEMGSTSTMGSSPRTPSEASFTVTTGTTETHSEAPRRWLVLTEYYQLGSLAHFVQSHGTHVLGQRLFMAWAKDLLRGLIDVHAQNIIHGDIKPQNCFIGRDFRLHIGDFSSSVLVTPRSLAADGIAIGTTNYTPPELCTSEPTSFTPAADIFSAALTLLYMLGGYEPYEQLLSSDRSHDAMISDSSRRSKRRLRVSSSSQTIEMHMHLQKGDAWEWEERRRLAQLGDLQDDGRRLPRLRRPATSHITARVPVLIDSDPSRLAFEDVQVPVPLECIDTPPGRVPDLFDTYSGSMVPIQTFLTGTHVVPPDLRRLIRLMASPDPGSRPTASQVLDQLARIS